MIFRFQYNVTDNVLPGKMDAKLKENAQLSVEPQPSASISTPITASSLSNFGAVDARWSFYATYPSLLTFSLKQPYTIPLKVCTYYCYVFRQRLDHFLQRTKIRLKWH